MVFCLKPLSCRNTNQPFASDNFTVLMAFCPKGSAWIRLTAVLYERNELGFNPRFRFI